MRSTAQNFVVLPDQPGWPRTRLAGLEIDIDGAVILARIPGAADGVSVDPANAYELQLNGFAVSLCGQILFAPPADAPDDPALASQGTAGLAASRDLLYVADENAARVLVFRLPGLELSSSWDGPFKAPRRVALDGAGRAYVLDAGLKKVLRVDSSGRVDSSYDTGEIAVLADGLDLCVSSDGTSFVSVTGKPELFRFSATGTTLDPLTPPEGASDLRPGALAGTAGRLYVADRSSGLVWIYDLGARRWLAPVPRFRAAVAGLATDGDRHLYVRTGTEASYLRLDARSAHVSTGILEAGPFDAGERSVWLRVHADADVPEGTRVRVETALADNDNRNTQLVWRSAPSLDALVRAPEPPDVPPDPKGRFLSIRVHFEADDPSQSPRLRQVVAETTADDHLARLPAVYARKDAEGDGFLRRWLEAFRAELGDQELEIASLAQRLDPATAPDDHLEWLASWAAFDLPPAANTAARRALLLDAHRLYERRGTVQGLREMVRIYTGVDCEIVESFRSRHLWALDGQARLGFDTGLLHGLPDGMVVPGPSLPEPALQGLRAEYFLDDRLGTSAAAPDRGGDRCEPHFADPPLIDGNGRFPSFRIPTPPAGRTLDAFSVLWTGQVRARYSELYAFFFAHDGGARLYVDDQLLIDSWITPGDREPRGSLPLSAERWYSVRIEYWSDNFTGATPKLSWSSRSQVTEIVPQECLYSVADDNINPEARRADGGADAMIVGDTVVGAHGPLAAEDFGAPLFDDTAHQFTVRLNAAAVKPPGKLDAVRAVLDAEKPAHTDYHLCVVQPTFLVGTQARVGIDAIVAPVALPGRYGEGRLGLNARLGISPAHDDGTLRVDENLRIGPDAVVR